MPRVTVYLITFIKVLLKNQIHWLIQLYVNRVKIQMNSNQIFEVNRGTHKFEFPNSFS
jgi:hypothetical protein